MVAGSLPATAVSHSEEDPLSDPVRSFGAPESVTLEAKVAFLRRRESYPGSPATVEPVETRLSWVFLTPERAWKLKKPLRYDHLDFEHIEARREDCEAECRLNRPLAPGVYLGVETLTCDARGALAINGPGRPVDYLVCMRRLPRERCLETQIEAGTLDRPGIERAAEFLAAFYRDAPAAGRVDPEAIAGEVEHEYAQLRDLPLRADPLLERLHEGLQAALARHRAALRRRTRVEVHGDLRPQHVYPGASPVFLDRLTFRRELRLMDPVEELAFLDLDCERLGARWPGARFLEAHARLSEDSVAAELIDLYRARRGLLWALLSGRHLLQGGADRHWGERARAYLRLGLEGLSPP